MVRRHERGHDPYGCRATNEQDWSRRVNCSPPAARIRVQSLSNAFLTLTDAPRVSIHATWNPRLIRTGTRAMATSDR